MSETNQHRLVRQLGYEWGFSITQSTLSHLEVVPADKPLTPYLLALDRKVAERAAALVEEGLTEELASVWEQTARDAIEALLAAHDEVAVTAPTG